MGDRVLGKEGHPGSLLAPPQDLAQCVNEVKRDNETLRQITNFQLSIEEPGERVGREGGGVATERGCHLFPGGPLPDALSAV